MGKRTLRVGEFVSSLDASKRAAIYAVPHQHPTLGILTFGIYLGGNVVLRDEVAGDDKTFVFVLDSPSLCFGYVWANRIRRAVL